MVPLRLLGGVAAVAGVCQPAFAQSNIDLSKQLSEALNRKGSDTLQKAFMPNAQAGMFSHFVVTKVKPSKLDVGAVNMRQTGVEPIDPLVSQLLEARNCNAGPQTFSTTFELSETESTSYSFTFGFTQSVTASFQTGEGVKVGGEINFSANQSVTNATIKSKTYTWTAPVTINALPFTYQLGQLQLAQSRANGTFTMPVTVGDKVEVHYTYRQKQPLALNQAKPYLELPGTANILVNTLLPDPASRTFQLEGTFKGVTFGTASGVVSEAIDLSDKNSPAYKQYCITHIIDPSKPAGSTVSTIAAPKTIGKAAGNTTILKGKTVVTATRR